MMYHVMIPSTRIDTPAFVELTKTESYKNAQAIADDHKANTGHNCYVESRSVVYVTSTIDEAISQMRDDTAAARRARAYDNRTEVARVATAEDRRVAAEWAADALRHGR